MKNELIFWFEDRYDPDELVDLLGLTVEDIVRKFYERAEEFKLAEQNGCEGEEEAALEERL